MKKIKGEELKIGKPKFNLNGKPISEEEYNKRFADCVHSYESTYEVRVCNIVNQINNRCKTDREKLKMLFEFLSNDDMKYDLQSTSFDGRMAQHRGYVFPPYGNEWRVPQSKYSTILFNSGVCDSYSRAFEDISNRLGIRCKTVTGNNGSMDHAWNVVLENGELKHIDVTYAITEKRISGYNKMNYFMKSLAELNSVCGRERTMEQEENELIKELNKIEIKSKINVKGRSDKPQITIRDRREIGD
jgi:transglutaminase/protease-like cytokinesis protein 3